MALMQQMSWGTFYVIAADIYDNYTTEYTKKVVVFLENAILLKLHLYFVLQQDSLFRLLLSELIAINIHLVSEQQEY